MTAQNVSGTHQLWRSSIPGSVGANVKCVGPCRLRWGHIGQASLCASERQAKAVCFRSTVATHLGPHHRPSCKYVRHQGPCSCSVGKVHQNKSPTLGGVTFAVRWPTRCFDSDAGGFVSECFQTLRMGYPPVASKRGPPGF